MASRTSLPAPTTPDPTAPAGPRVGPLLGALSTVLVVAVASSLAVPGLADRVLPAGLAVASAGTGAALLRRIARPGRAGRPWRLLGVALLLVGAGQAVAGLLGVGLNPGRSGPQDLPLVLAVPFVLAGSVALLGGEGPGRWWSRVGSRSWLDAGIVLVAVSVVAAVVVGEALGSSGTAGDPLVAAALPAVGALLAAIGLLTAAVLPAGRRATGSWVTVQWLATAVVAVNGAVAAALDSATLDLLTVVAWAVVLVAVVLGAAADPGPGVPPPRAEAGTQPLSGVLLSWCSASAVGVLLVAGVAAGSPVGLAEGVGALVLLLLTAARSVLWVADGERLTRRLARAEAWFRSLVLDADDVTVVLHRGTRLAWVSDSVQGRLGYGPRELADRAFADLVHPEDGAALSAAVAGEPGAHAFRVRTRAGAWREVEALGGGTDGAAGVEGRVLHLRDVTDRRAAERELQRMAFTDFLTGLPNRARLMAALGVARARAQEGGPASVLLLDLDGFKSVNDVAGHEAGDRLLAEVADELRGLVREPDLVARLGGDEFAVLVRSGLTEAAALAERVVAGLDREHRASAPDGSPDGPVFALSASIGVTELRAEDDVATTLRQADLALRAAKAAGKSCVRSHGDAADAATTRRTRLARDLPQALAAGQLRVDYQPVVGVLERRVLGVEALVRWDHPVLGEVGPDEFVPLAEDDGLIVPLQRWVLDRACGELAALRAGGRDLKLGVNISVRHLQAGCLVADVAQALAASGLPPHGLMIEVTESVLMSEQDRLDSDLQTLHDMGCVVSLDDFGRGYSSFAYLARLPVDVLKMDREFLAGIEHDARGAAVVGSVIALGRQLQIDVVAEGVETPGELAALQELGCRFVQGFLLARPARAADLAAVVDGFDPEVLRPTERSPSFH
ncbi:hypothetical protein ASG36_15075 [Geodermatophilus sp. Leaf369]|uniref:putative bifunctional diguanylate cyclase/phosphodiesterase n=1 Tax=Geodermatophilus sp. Leaf369 TaxID=1736354 RepID=UPI0006F72446|nr:bifunctional diguanylate cyclase/phosphodiesterase [Geodermatophilus sp. Leaf369]KQS57899.1 hypothetical protein ASG36_15075 [Geodermatophilus sp. Leaf369]